MPVAIPAPLRCGEPTDFYPYRWSVVPWFEGFVAAQAPLRSAQAPTVAKALRTLHVPASADVPANPYRDRPLTAYAGHVQGRFDRAKAEGVDLGVDVAAVESLWADTHETGIDWDAMLVHGDLHPKNVITRDGLLVAIIDWGDLTAGDPAVDLSAIWSLFEPDAHESFWNNYGHVSKDTKARARAWAVHLPSYGSSRQPMSIRFLATWAGGRWLVCSTMAMLNTDLGHEPSTG